tara:strand:+ start:17058 stop:17339 length:282 start_codon:yes stop_codon:yes gene_type:complete
MKHNLDVMFRILAAIAGGYLVSVLFSFVVVLILVWMQATTQHEAVMVATMFSYVVYFAVIILSFCRKSAWLLWRDLLLITCLLGAIYWLMGEL